MSKKIERESKYKQIAALAEWVNDNREEVAEDGMSIVMGIADNEKIRRLCLTGGVMEIYTIMETLRQGAADAFDEVYGVNNDIPE